MPPVTPVPADDALILLLDHLGLSGLAEPLRAAASSEALTPLAMFAHADGLVQAVMLGLLAASVLAWAIWGSKLVQLTLAQRRLGRDYRALAARGSLGAALSKGMLARMQAAALAEIRASEGLPAAGVKERVANELSRIEAGAARALQSGVTAVGSIGSTAPFVGLFGTVWGIMNAFVGIAESGSSSLAVVAPGIAEALMATALGLVAAIPAVLLYNHLTRAVGGYRACLADAAALVERTLSRDLDRARLAPTVTALHLVAE
ncbi:outer membrane transport energization protein ExbB [Rhodobacter viridis]|uniref:Biopolymer transport protein ExbB n=1 Tax=Rhodobacter viridis TaxID=1054202 RepID=A0A318U2X5_9RHOB|nr:tonB-system energizer ExbB [Rhodobacter viridis]PYF11851.1 outer membrane transport energization protein ExbB [Rhodobacter viridis]